MLFPACTGLGDATFVTERFGPEVPTIVVTTAVLLAGIGSRTEELTVADPVITVPFGVPLATFTTRVNVAELSPGMLALVQTELLPFPARQLQPAGGVSETNVVLFGSGNARVALSPALGPLLLTTTVYVIVPFVATGLGEPTSVTDRSALEITVATSVEVSFSGVTSPPPLTVAVFVRVAGAD